MYSLYSTNRSLAITGSTHIAGNITHHPDTVVGCWRAMFFVFLGFLFVFLFCNVVWTPPSAKRWSKLGTLLMVLKPSSYIHLKGLLGGNITEELAELIKLGIHQLPSAVSRVYQRHWFRIPLKSLTSLLMLVMLQSLPKGILLWVHYHSRCVIVSGKFWQQITETWLKWLKQ